MQSVEASPVSVGVVVLRRTAPDLPRGFRVPLYPLTPVLAVAGRIGIIQDPRPVTIFVLLGWATVALTWYFLYGRRHSELGRLSAWRPRSFGCCALPAKTRLDVRLAIG